VIPPVTVPDDLRVEIRGGHLLLTSQGRTVDLDIAGRSGVFRDGPVRWSRLVLLYLAPALWQLQVPTPGGIVSREAS